jgi:hypothetical protein
MYIAYMGEVRNTNKILAGKSEGNRLFRRPRITGENKSKMDSKEILFENGYWKIWLKMVSSG